VEQYVEQHPAFAAAFENPLPVPAIDPDDVSAAMIYLCGNSGRYVTGVTLPLDAGVLLK
jgi:hypothetical protein